MSKSEQKRINLQKYGRFEVSAIKAFIDAYKRNGSQTDIFVAACEAARDVEELVEMAKSAEEASYVDERGNEHRFLMMPFDRTRELLGEK